MCVCVFSSFSFLTSSKRPCLVRDSDLIEEGGVGGAQSSLHFAFPPELADGLHRLYHLRRGAMLSPGMVRSLDDRAQLRDLYLRLPLDDCLCMMAPSLWSVNTTGRDFAPPLSPVPSDTLTLWNSVRTRIHALCSVGLNAITPIMP